MEAEMTNVLVLASQMEEFASFGMYNFIFKIFVCFFVSFNLNKTINTSR